MIYLIAGGLCAYYGIASGLGAVTLLRPLLDAISPLPPASVAMLCTMAALCASLVSAFFALGQPIPLPQEDLLLLAVAWLFVDRKFAMDTAYASILLSTLLVLLEKLYPMARPLSGEPVLDLLFAIALPAIASALLFYIGASSGGTDVLAMLLKKYTNIKNIGNALFLSDLVMVLAACFVFDIETALYSFVGLTVKSFMIDNIIQSITLCKSVTISCSDPEPICDFILKELDRSATVVGGYGAYTHEPRSVIFTTMNRRQADRLRAYLHENHPHAFLSVSSTNEVFGKGFTQV